jgi:hypothetical protein
VNRDAIARALESLQSEHTTDRDGGDRLVRAVIDYSGSLGPADRDALEAHLLSLVDSTEAAVWRMALEVLVRTGTPETGRAFIPMLTADDRSPEWSDAVVLAMMRLGCANALGMCRDYVREELRQHHASALPLLTWLYRTDIEFALPLAARFYAESLAPPSIRSRVHAVSGDERARIMESVRRQIGSQLEGLLANSTAIVLDLIDQIAALDVEAGRIFASLLLDYLARPDARAQFGRRAVDALGGAVRLRA